MVRRVGLLIALCAMWMGASAQIIDSQITLTQALAGSTAPEQLMSQMAIVDVEYYSTDGKLHRGQIVIDSTLRGDIEEIFAFIRQIRYPIDMVIPIKFDLPDNGTTMANLNNIYSFHYRQIVNKSPTDKSVKLSRHSYGRAVDFNPFNNPYITSSGKIIPEGGKYDTTDPRTLTAEHPLVKKLIAMGWIWGGNWTTPKDYMHFEKPILTK